MRSILLLSLFSVLTFCGVAFASPETAANTAHAFSLKDQDGATHTLDQYKGKVVVLEWTNPDCPFVKRHYENGAMKKLAESYTNKGAVWLAVNSTHYADLAVNKAWAEKNGLKYPILSDQEGTVGKAYGAKTTPFMTVIDTKGQIAYQGALDDDPYGDKEAGVNNYVAQAVDALLQAKPVTVASTKSYGCSVKYKS